MFHICQFVESSDPLFRSTMTEVPRPAGSTAGQADPLAGWDDTPLFMRKFDGSEENHTIAALQSLMFDDPPDGACPVRRLVP